MMNENYRLAHCISCRITDRQFETLERLCETQQMTPSQYLRSVITLLLSMGDCADAGAVLLDRKSVWKLDRELACQGRNLNQGIHALNAIALYVRENKHDMSWLRQAFDDARLSLNTVIDYHDELIGLFRAIKDKTIIGGD